MQGDAFGGDFAGNGVAEAHGRHIANGSQRKPQPSRPFDAEKQRPDSALLAQVPLDLVLLPAQERRDFELLVPLVIGEQIVGRLWARCGAADRPARPRRLMTCAAARCAGRGDRFQARLCLGLAAEEAQLRPSVLGFGGASADRGESGRGSWRWADRMLRRPAALLRRPGSYASSASGARRHLRTGSPAAPLAMDRIRGPATAGSAVPAIASDSASGLMCGRSGSTFLGMRISSASMPVATTRDADAAFHVVQDGVAEDDVGVGIDFGADAVGGLLRLRTASGPARR